jgi:hypothetical protein
MTRYVFAPDESRLFVHASSSIHGIDTDADGVEGDLDLVLAADGSIDLAQPVAGTLSFALTRLSSGNPLYDVETERRIEVKRYPLVEATLTGLELASGSDAGEGEWTYRVAGDLTFHGVTQALEGEIGFRSGADGTVQLWGEQVLDVRSWDIKPPKLGLIKVHPDIRVRLEVTAHSA